jgi:hypothetical protein
VQTGSASIIIPETKNIFNAFARHLATVFFYGRKEAQKAQNYNRKTPNLLCLLLSSSLRLLRFFAANILVAAIQKKQRFELL